MHFRPEIVNAAALERVLDRLGIDGEARTAWLETYEEVFDHRSFTGRSGSMYGYEGIGSIYWHMVAKLLLAVQEAYWDAVEGSDDRTAIAGLAAAYRRIRAGFGHRATPATFGAIPTDCYSHTPAHAGAQQPGMTGQVKEEILARFGELGLHVSQGRLLLAPGLLPAGEVLDGIDRPVELTVCGVPATIVTGPRDSVTLERADGTSDTLVGLELDAERSRELFARTGTITQVRWTLGTDTVAAWRNTASGAR
jgi:hypothetical protein